MTAADDANAAMAALSDWWRDQAQDEINRTVPKAVEYGAGDLAEIGRVMGRLMGRSDLTEQEATEIGIFFYLYGKLARWEQAILERRSISDDTLFDIRVYAMMAARTRQVGGWPWANGATEHNDVQLFSFPVVTDPSLKPDEIRIVGADGTHVIKIDLAAELPPIHRGSQF